MKKKLLLLLFALYSCCVSIAQVKFQNQYRSTLSYSNTVTSALQTTDGGYVMLGDVSLCNMCLSDAGLIKTDANGNLLWANSIGDSISAEENSAVIQTTDGGYLIAGHTYIATTGQQDFLIIKTDSIGNYIWSKSYGGLSLDVARSVLQNDDGGYTIAGNGYNIGAGAADILLIRTDSLGSLIWSKTIGGIHNDFAYCIRHTIDGGYVISGSTTSFGNPFDDVCLLKTDDNGNVQWVKTFGGIDLEKGTSVQQTADSGYVVAGYTLSFGSTEAYLIKTDTSGNMSWSKTYGIPTSAIFTYSVQQTTDYGYVLAGTVSDSSFNDDAIIIKTDSSGNHLWSTKYGANNVDESGAVGFQSSDGGYIASGNSGPALNKAAFLVKTDSAGVSDCNQSAISIVSVAPATIEGAHQLITGTPTLIIDLPEPIEHFGGVKFNLCPIAFLNPSFFEKTFQLFPNPTTGSFTISFFDIITNGKIEITTLLGEKILTDVIINQNFKNINLSRRVKGIYFVKINDGSKTYVQKLIID